MEIFTAEVVGTAILILLGDGVVAGVLLARSKAEGAGWIVITFGWGMAVAVAVYAVAQFSGAHLNPAVTIGYALTDVTPWDDVPTYLAGEFVGAFIGAILVYLVPSTLARDGRPGSQARRLLDSTGDTEQTREPGDRDHRDVHPALWHLRNRRALRRVRRRRHRGRNAGDRSCSGSFVPLLVGFLVFGIGLSLGGPTGYAINPARDLAPRIAHAVLPIPGKRDSDWDYACVPVVGPIIGGSPGAITYQALVAPGTGNLEGLEKLTGLVT